jgi:hypothetical protein
MAGLLLLVLPSVLTSRLENGASLSHDLGSQRAALEMYKALRPSFSF